MTRANVDKQKAILHRRAMRYGGQTIAGALSWLRKHYTGTTRSCIIRQMCAPAGAMLPAYELDSVYASVLRRAREVQR